jgi:hypothetical protein
MTHHVACLLMLLFACCLPAIAHNVLMNYEFVCNEGGGASAVNIMLFNDYGLNATFSTTGHSTSGWGCTPFPSSTTLQFGPTYLCASQSPTGCCTVATDGHGCSPYYNPNVPTYGLAACGPACQYLPAPITLTNTGTVSSPKYSEIIVCGYANWTDGVNFNPWPGNCDSSSQCSGESGTLTPTAAMIATACPPDNFNCTSPQTSACGVANCRCNSFEFVGISTTGSSTTFAINVTNYCAPAFYYAAFGITGLTLTSPATGAYQGTNYAWTISTLDGTVGSAQQTNPAAYWLRFNAPASNGGAVVGNAKMNNVTGHGAQWDVFNFTVTGYTPSYEWIVQGHEGGFWDTYSDVNVGFCYTQTNGCPPGFAGYPSCTQCDTNPLPGGNEYSWLCIPNGDLDAGSSASPYILEVVPAYLIGTSQYPTPPDFVPYNVTTGAPSTDAFGYALYCNCTRVVYSCANLSYCQGYSCNAQNNTCNCPPGSYANCTPVPTPPPTTTAPPTPPPGVTVTVLPTTLAPTLAPGVTTLPPLQTTPAPVPCYNGGLFCSGNGVCSGDGCACDSSYSGPACDIAVTQPPTASCTSYSNCSQCMVQAEASGLSCSWCLDVVGGGCVPNTSCANALTSCTASSVNFKPEPCPDDCSGARHGVCVNQTCASYQAAGEKIPRVNGQEACINTTLNAQYDPQFGSVTVAGSNASYCLCERGYQGLNCGGRSSSLGTALAISGGIIAVIVICGVVFVVILGLGAKKGVDWIALNQTAGANFHQNPLAHDRNTDCLNPIHEEHRP